MKEIYKIYDFFSFALIDRTNGLKLFRTFNPEYKYFKSDRKLKNHLDIIVMEDNIRDKDKKFTSFDGKWKIAITDREEANEIKLISLISRGFRKQIPFLTLKNLLVRSLISKSLLVSDAFLVHSCAFELNGKTFILAGRPGVFKTSILMDVIRDYEASFIGEENSLVHNGLVYPFPLNIDSIDYKIRYYKNENPSSKWQKMMLGLHLIKKHWQPPSCELKLSMPRKVDAVFYLEKGEEFMIEESKLDNILPLLVNNEVQELSITPTHTLSGIKENQFSEIENSRDPSFIKDFEKTIGKLMRKNFSESKCYFVRSPNEYDKNITNTIVNKLK